MIGVLGMRSVKGAARRFTYRGRDWLAAVLRVVLGGQGDRTAIAMEGQPHAPHSQRLATAIGVGWANLERTP